MGDFILVLGGLGNTFKAFNDFGNSLVNTSFNPHGVVAGND